MSNATKVSPLTVEPALSSVRGTQDQDVLLEPQPRRRYWLWIALGCALLVLLRLVLPTVQQWMGTERSVSRTQLRFSTVTQETFIRDIGVQGTVVAAVRPTLYAASPGTVTLTVRAGDDVKAGDLIATIDSPELQNALDQEQATLNSLITNLKRQTIENKKLGLAGQQAADLALVELTAAERELRRAEQAWKVQAISLQDFEKATDDVEKARLDLRHAQQAAKLDTESLAFELQTLRLERDRQRLTVRNFERRVEGLQLKTPVDGIVGTLAVDNKTVVAANAEIATVIDLSALEVELSIADSYADDLVLGTPVIVKFAGEEHAGTLISISPDVINSTVSGRVRFVNEQSRRLRQNQRVSARIILEAKDQTLVVDRGPFYDTGGGRLIYKVSGDVAQRTAILTGSTSVSKIEILDGLQAGDQVIISEISRFDGANRVLLND